MRFFVYGNPEAESEIPLFKFIVGTQIVDEDIFILRTVVFVFFVTYEK